MFINEAEKLAKERIEKDYRTTVFTDGQVFYTSPEEYVKWKKLADDTNKQLLWGIEAEVPVYKKEPQFSSDYINSLSILPEIELIKIITNLHPSLGVDLGYSAYVGGMRDTGEWSFRKLLKLNKQELLELMLKL